MYYETTTTIWNLQKVHPPNNLDYTEHQIQHNPKYLKETIISVHLSSGNGKQFFISAQVFRSKTKESVSLTSCGTGIIVALAHNSTLSQR